MKTIKVGVIGAGAIAQNHCQGIAAHPQAEVVAVADLSAARCKALQKEFDIAKMYASAAELIADPDLDAVTVALPNCFHAPTSIAALQAGKHVLCDKPFAMNQKEAAAVIAAAKKARKVMMVGMNLRWSQEAQTIKALVERGDLGDVYQGRASYLRRSGIPKLGTWFGQKKMAGGGALLDIGVHALDLSLHLMGNFKPATVTGAVFTNFGNRGLGEGGWGKSDPGKKVFDVDDSATALIKLRGGATLSLDVTWAQHQKEGSSQNVYLHGTEAGAGLYPAEIYRYGKKKGEYEVVAPQNVKIAQPHMNRHYNWVDAILKLDKPMCTLLESLVVQKILDAIYVSAKTGKEVRIK